MIYKVGIKLKENQEEMAKFPETSESWEPLLSVDWRKKTEEEWRDLWEGSREMNAGSLHECTRWAPEY